MFMAGVLSTAIISASHLSLFLPALAIVPYMRLFWRFLLSFFSFRPPSFSHLNRTLLSTCTYTKPFHSSLCVTSLLIYIYIYPLSHNHSLGPTYAISTLPPSSPLIPSLPPSLLEIGSHPEIGPHPLSQRPNSLDVHVRPRHSRHLRFHPRLHTLLHKRQHLP